MKEIKLPRESDKEVKEETPIESTEIQGESPSMEIDSSELEHSRLLGKEMLETFELEGEDADYVKNDQGNIEARPFNSVEITSEGDIFGKHEDVKDFLRACEVTERRDDTKSTFESHHLVGAKILENAGLNPNDGIAVAVSSGDHMEILHGIAGADPQAEFNSTDELISYYTEKYGEMGVPEYGKKAVGFIDEHQDHFDILFESDAVTEVEAEVQSDVEADSGGE